MARIKAPTVKELLDAARATARHLHILKKRITEQVELAALAWEQEHFPLGDATVYMEGKSVMNIDNRMGTACARIDKFNFPSLGEPTGQCIVTLRVRCGVSGNAYPMKYDGNVLSLAAGNTWTDPKIETLPQRDIDTMTVTLKSWQNTHKERLRLAAGVPEGYTIPVTGDLLASLSAGEFGANHNAVFNLLYWDHYVSGRSKKMDQLRKDVFIIVGTADNVAEEIKIQRKVAEIEALFAGTRFTLSYDDVKGHLQFKPCDLLKRTEAGDKRNATTYLEAGRRKRL